MRKFLIIAFVLSLIWDKSHSQDTSFFAKITSETVKLIAKDLKNGGITLSEICFKNVRNYLKKPLLKEFVSDTAYGMNNYKENSSVDSCFCSYNLYATMPSVKKQKKEEYTLFMSPYYENTIIARVVKKLSVLYYDGQFYAPGTNYFYLLKYGKSGKVEKYKKFQLQID